MDSKIILSQRITGKKIVEDSGEICYQVKKVLTRIN